VQVFWEKFASGSISGIVVTKLNMAEHFEDAAGTCVTVAVPRTYSESCLA
jgi:hypothetical protein